jgi:hypothetical protein
MISVFEWKKLHNYVCTDVCGGCFYCCRSNSIAYACALAKQETERTINVFPKQGRCDSYISCEDYQLQHKISWEDMLKKRQSITC